ncbi:uncharacterized protein LOC111115653 isoform X1 [Crassostrea virginica]
MDSSTNMTPFVKCLMFTVVCLMIAGSCCEHSLDRRANVAKRSDNDTYYNIYTKINTLEKYVSNLETKLQTRTKLLRQVLKSVIEMDSNLGLSDKNLKKERKLASKKNALGFTTKLSGSYSSTSSIIRGSLILYNGGNAYNGTVFTCPSPGLYLFHVSLMSNSRLGGILIYKNSQQLTLAYTGDENPQVNGASVSAAVWLSVGDQVYLCPYSSPLWINLNSAFTGVKVH